MVYKKVVYKKVVHKVLKKLRKFTTGFLTLKKSIRSYTFIIPIFTPDYHIFDLSRM